MYYLRITYDSGHHIAVDKLSFFDTIHARRYTLFRVRRILPYSNHNTCICLSSILSLMNHKRAAVWIIALALLPSIVLAWYIPSDSEKTNFLFSTSGTSQSIGTGSVFVLKDIVCYNASADGIATINDGTWAYIVQAIKTSSNQMTWQWHGEEYVFSWQINFTSSTSVSCNYTGNKIDGVKWETYREQNTPAREWIRSGDAVWVLELWELRLFSFLIHVIAIWFGVKSGYLLIKKFYQWHKKD